MAGSHDASLNPHSSCNSAELGCGGLGTLSISAQGPRPVGSSAPVGPTEASLLEVILFVLPIVLPIAAAIYLGIRLRGRTAARSATG